MEQQRIFEKLEKGDIIFTLEKDRRAGYPIFDKAQVIKVGSSKPMANPNPGDSGAYMNAVELQIQDPYSVQDIYLPANKVEGIYNGIYYTTDIRCIANEVSLQGKQALDILNNTERYKTIAEECNNILSSIENEFAQSKSPTAPIQEVEALRNEFNQKFEYQATILEKQGKIMEAIADSLGLNKKQSKGNEVNK